jgi:hypothetical protein
MIATSSGPQPPFPIAVIIHEDAVAPMSRLMKERGITRTTSCTLRGFTCAQVKVDPKVVTPAKICERAGRQSAIRSKASPAASRPIGNALDPAEEGVDVHTSLWFHVDDKGEPRPS